MNPSFEPTERIMAIDRSLLTQLNSIKGQFAANARDGRRSLDTLLTCWDDTEKTRTRAASFPETVNPIPLTDGRLAVVGLWSKTVIAAWQRGALPAEELTVDQLEQLRVKEVIVPIVKE